jgi:sortase A
MMRPPDATRPGFSIIASIGGLLVGAGAVILAFVLFMTFGTALIQGSHQQSLRTEIERVLPAPGHTVPGPPRTIAPVAPPPLGAPVAQIQIPAISLNMIVVQGTAEPDLEQGPGHYVGTPLPGEPGNVAIAGHRTTWARPFYNANALVPGDPIIVTTNRGVFTYSVRRVFIVDPSDVSVLKPTATPSLTLTTCNPRFSASQRLIVRAVLTASSVTPVAKVRTITHYSVIVSQRRPSPWPAILLGLATLVAVIGTVIAFRRPSHAWPVTVLGGLASIGLLLATFAYVAPLLPPNL